MIYCLIEKEYWNESDYNAIIIQCSKFKEELDEIKCKLEQKFKNKYFEIIDI